MSLHKTDDRQFRQILSNLELYVNRFHLFFYSCRCFWTEIPTQNFLWNEMYFHWNFLVIDISQIIFLIRLSWWPPLWSSGHSSWLQIQRPGFDSRCYQIFWEVVYLKRGPLSLVNTIEELSEWKSSCSGLETREYGRRDQSRWQCGTFYSQTFALTSPTRGGRSVGIVRSRTQAVKYFFFYRGDSKQVYSFLC
jgi:hypothetical protein